MGLIETPLNPSITLWYYIYIYTVVTMDTCIIEFNYNIEFMHMRVCVCVFANVTNVYAHGGIGMCTYVYHVSV